MNGFATGFLTGFMGDQAQKISERKDEAQDYFNKRLETAQDVAMKSRSKYEGKMNSALSRAKQLMALGVPERTIMGAISQDPAGLDEMFQTVQEAQLKGVPMDGDFYNTLYEVNKDFNPEDGEDISSLLKRIYVPLSNNIKADPQGYEFDKKGTIWATMMGYNAMDKAVNKLETTPVLGDVSAAQVLRDWGGDEDPVSSNPLGATVTLNASKLGEGLRDAKAEQTGEKSLTISQRGTILTQFDKMKEDILTKEDVPGGIQDRNEYASRKAVGKLLEAYPEAINLPEVARWAKSSEAGTGSTTAPTAPVASTATPTPKTPSNLPDRLPSGAVLVKDNGDGTSTWKKPDGSTKTYYNTDVEQLTQRINRKPSTENSKSPTPGWLDNLGSEYDK